MPRRDHFQGMKAKRGGKVKRKRVIRCKKKLSYKNGGSIFDDSISSTYEKEDPGDSADSIDEVVKQQDSIQSKIGLELKKRTSSFKMKKYFTREVQEKD